MESVLCHSVVLSMCAQSVEESTRRPCAEPEAMRPIRGAVERSQLCPERLITEKER